MHHCLVPVDKLFLNMTGLALPTFSPPACLGSLAKVLCRPVPLNHLSTPCSPRDFHSLPVSWAGTPPLSTHGVLPAHRCVGLNEAVLQVTGLLPLARAAQVVQLTQWVTQNIGEGTHTPSGT